MSLNAMMARPNGKMAPCHWPRLMPSQTRLRVQAKFFCAFKLIWAVQSFLKKYFSSSSLTQITSLIRAIPSHRGALRNVINAGRDAVDAAGACDERCRRGRRSRVVLTPRCWRQVCEKKRRRRCQTSLVTGESTKETVKPLRGECRVISGVTVVTMLVCFFTLHARLRAHWAPGIPCAL
jgi:hypothetical protein